VTPSGCSQADAYCLQDPMGFLMDENAPLTSNFQDSIYSKTTTPSKLFRNLQKEQEQFIKDRKSGGTVEKITNCFMASKRRSSFILLVIFQICVRSMLSEQSIFVSRRWWMMQREWIVLHTTGPGAWTEALSNYRSYQRSLSFIKFAQSTLQQQENDQNKEKVSDWDALERQRAEYLLYLISTNMKVEKQNIKQKLQIKLNKLDKTMTPEARKYLEETESRCKDKNWIPLSLKQLLLKDAEHQTVITIPSNFIAPAICTFFSNYRPCTVKSSFAIQLEGLSWVANRTTKNLTHLILELMFWLQIRNQRSLHNRVLKELQEFEIPKGLTVEQTQKQRIQNGLQLFHKLTPKLENRAFRFLSVLEKKAGNVLNSWINRIRIHLQIAKANKCFSLIQDDESFVMVFTCGFLLFLVCIFVVGITALILAIRKKT
jgi:hypothetical protein